MNAVLEAHDIRVTHGGRTVLEVPHLALPRGKVLAVIGPNGSGKSTLLRVLAALQRPARGTLTFHGHALSWRNTLAYRRRIAVILQDPLLLSLSAYRNAALGLHLRGVWGSAARERVQAWLNRFRVGHLAARPAHTLSGGEAQRVALARAFVLEPEVLFLDEPFAGLDTPTRLEILPDLRRILRDTGTTALFVTHDRDEALTLADQVAVLLGGRLRQVATPERVFSHPADAEVAAFVGVENVLPARVVAHRGGLSRLDLGGVALNAVGEWPAGDRVFACIRPEDLTLRPGQEMAPSATDAANALPGRIADIIPLGSQVRVHVQVAEVTLRALIPRRAWRDLRLREGVRVTLTVEPGTVHVISPQSVWKSQVSGDT